MPSAKGCRDPKFGYIYANLLIHDFLADQDLAKAKQVFEQISLMVEAPEVVRQKSRSRIYLIDRNMDCYFMDGIAIIECLFDYGNGGIYLDLSKRRIDSEMITFEFWIALIDFLIETGVEILLLNGHNLTSIPANLPWEGTMLMEIDLDDNDFSCLPMRLFEADCLKHSRVGGIRGCVNIDIASQLVNLKCSAEGCSHSNPIPENIMEIRDNLVREFETNAMLPQPIREALYPYVQFLPQ